MGRRGTDDLQQLVDLAPLEVERVPELLLLGGGQSARFDLPLDLLPGLERRLLPRLPVDEPAPRPLGLDQLVPPAPIPGRPERGDLFLDGRPGPACPTPGG